MTARLGLPILLLGILTLWWPARASAACMGSSPTRTAASASRADVGDCYAAAQNGDTILVPAGTSAWTSALTVAKDVSIIGAGIGQTNISRSGVCFYISLAHNVRISGFSFTACTIDGTGLPGESKAFRIDHNSFTSSAWVSSNIHGSCQTTQRHPTGLWDNNQFHHYRIVTSGSNCMRWEANAQDQLWSQTPPFGSGTGVVYVEDNTFSGSGTSNFLDGNYGGRYVARFNTLVNQEGASTGHIEVHAVQGNNRAVQLWEIYRNTMTGPGGFFGLAYIRGGSGFVWGNRVPSSTSTMKLNVRRATQNADVAGLCDGTSNWDQNTPGQSGSACRDQIGRSKDDTLWTTGAAYTQQSTPAYFWDNIAGASTQYNPTLHGTTTVHLATDRDYYQQNTSFNGTTGVGVGPIANRPATCTPGVGYWATDQGEWNAKQAGPDGLLYKCSSPNTWSVHYIPYTYPHPLQGSGGGSAAPAPAPSSPPAAPTGLSATGTQ